MAELTAQELAATFNATNVTITVEEGEDSKFTYFSPGPQTNFTNNTEGSVDIGGTRLPRSYVFTWLSAFGEESIPSSPSETVYCREGEKVVVDDLPESYTSPDGRPRLVRGIRLYRSVVSASGTEYFRLATLWFPNTLVLAVRDGDIVTAESLYPHALIEGDRINIPSGTFATGNSGVVEEVVDRFRFKFKTEASGNTSVVTGNIVDFYYDVSEDPTDDEPYYWGLQNGDMAPYHFLDDYDVGGLTTILPSLNYEPPPDELRGLVLLPSNIMAGFVGSKVYLSEPGQYHAWPSDYVLTFDYNVVGLAVNAGTLVVLTEGYPYRVDGNTPESMVPNKVDSMYPCLAKRSIVSTGTGVYYATHSGLALYSPARGSERVTKFVLDRETWDDFIDGAFEIVRATEFEDKYLAFFGAPGFNSGWGFTFEADPQLGGQLSRIELDQEEAPPLGMWTDPSSGDAYITDGSKILKYDPYNESIPFGEDAYLDLVWASKTYELPDPVDFGAMQATIGDIALAGPTEFSVTVFKTIQSYTASQVIDYDPNDPSELNRGRREIVRLKNGMKADRFAFTIRGNRAIASVSFATTPTALKKL